MNPTNYDQLRWCDRYKSSSVETHVEAFAKKIRKRKNFQTSLINANTQQRQIDVFYKQGWEYQHVHSHLSCDISDPIYLQEKPDQMKNQNLAKYYEDCKNFVQRLKTQHQDQTAFRVQARFAEPLIGIRPDQWKSDKYSAQQKRIFQNLACSKQVYKNFIITIEDAVKNMNKNLQKFESMDELTMPEYSYLNIKQILTILQGWLQALKGQNSQDSDVCEWLEQEHVEQITNMNQFMINFIQVAQTMRADKRSCLFNYQPEISVLTHIIHPILLSLAALYWKQRISWQNQYEHNPLNINYNINVPNTPLIQDTPHHQISRTVLLNLDGYQSQFNIELSKNLGNHLMYVSFPILQPTNSTQHPTFDTRFYKKIMFNSSRQLYEYQCQDYDVVYSNTTEGMDMDAQQLDLRKQLQIKYDPQKYFEQITKIYKERTTSTQANKNIYILPIRFRYLQEQLSTLFIDKNMDAYNYSSYFIWYLLKNFIFDDMRKFNPTHIVISYSGNVHIMDEHWIGILQELATISKRKLVLYPNFTIKFTQSLKQEYHHYDNFVTSNLLIENSCNSELMKKMSQFLKISSGTYNLQTPCTPQHLIPRYKLSKVNTYIRGLLNALSSQQYPQLKNRISDIFLRVDSLVINRSVEQNKKQIKCSIPSYYQQLFRHIRHILLHESNKFPQQLTEYVDKIRNQIRTMTNSHGQVIEDRYVDQILRALELGLASEKFSEVAYVYFKSRPDKIQYQQIKEEIKQEKSEESKNYNKNNLQDLYCLSLRYTSQNKQKLSLHITPQTQLHYRPNQTHKFRTNTGKKTANIMLMNNLKENQFVSYAGIVTLLPSNQMDKSKHKIHNQRVQMYPIVFNGMPDLPWSHFSVRSGWNYAETSRYYFFYWPAEYNILQAKLKSINQQTYQPRILNQIYISQIPQIKQHRLVFNRATLTDTTTIPRRFCTSLQLMQQNKIFILGGFYDREYNYLSLQTEITGLDLTHYDSQTHKCVVTNEKGTMDELDPKLKQNNKNKNNSYVRARRQYEVFQLDELYDLREEQMQGNNQIRTYIMIGGYGQNFVRPYSLMNCCYYQINIDLPTKSIKSIQRNYLYQKLLTCNIKGYIKNNNFFERLALYQKNMLKPNEPLSPQSYIAHRSIYCLTREQKQGKISQQLNIKTKYLFAINMYSNIKTQYQKIAIKIGEYVDNKTNDTSQFFLALSTQGNHYLTIRKNLNQHETTQIYLQKMQSKTTYQHVPLTHGSIVSIDIKFKYIYAIVKHDLYTNGKYALTQCQMPNEQSDVVLKIVHTFVDNLEQFMLFTARPLEVLLLHGVTFDNVIINDFVFRIPKKQGGKQQPIRKIAHSHYISSKKYKKCYTVMLKDENKDTKALEIQQISILLPQQNKPTSYNLRKYRLKMSTSTDFSWQPTSQYPIQFIEQATNNIIHILRIESTRVLQQQHELNSSFYSLSSSMLSSQCGYNEDNVVLVKIYGYNKKYYIGVVNMDDSRAKEMTVDGIVRVVVVNIDNSDARRIWEMAMPIQHHLKSLNKYKDMEII